MIRLKWIHSIVHRGHDSKYIKYFVYFRDFYHYTQPIKLTLLDIPFLIHLPLTDVHALPRVDMGCRELTRIAMGCGLPRTAKGCHRLPRVAFGCRELPWVPTDCCLCHGLPWVTTGSHGLPQVATNCHCLPRVVTEYHAVYKLLWMAALSAPCTALEGVYR